MYIYFLQYLCKTTLLLISRAVEESLRSFYFKGPSRESELENTHLITLDLEPSLPACSVGVRIG